MQRKDLIGELRRFLHDARIERDAGILLAVSGGRDSMALAKAFVLLNARSERPWRVHAAVVDHGLRAEAAKEARFVQSTLVRWGIGCETIRLTPPKRLPGGALAWAREGRYAGLEAIRSALRLSYVATAHHLDDQAETLLLRLVRGATPATLVGIRPVQGSLLRPLLGVRRRDVDVFVKKHGVPFVDDPSNDDPAHPRANVRHELLPLLERLGGEGVAARLAALAGDLAEDDDALSALTPRPAKPSKAARTLSLAVLTPLPAALRRRVVWAWLRASVRPAGQLQRAHLFACLALLEGKDPGAHVKLPGGAVVVRERQRLRITARRASSRPGASARTAAPGSAARR
jgi:tRNA(Ile)-lysidine synthase